MRKRKKKCCNYLLIIPLLLTVKNALKVCSATIIFEGNCFLLCISKSKFGIYMVGVTKMCMTMTHHWGYEPPEVRA